MKQTAAFHKAKVQQPYFLHWKTIAALNFGKLRRMLGYPNGPWAHAYKYSEIKMLPLQKKNTVSSSNQEKKLARAPMHRNTHDYTK